MPQKQCHKCLEWKDEEEDFYWRFKGIVRHHICKECQKPFQRAWYQGETKERHKKNVYERNKQVREEAKEFVYQYLLSHPCESCGEADPRVLEFHHTGNKEKAISEMVAGGYPIHKIEAEIASCKVLCANCHRKLTMDERGWFRGRK